MSRLFPAYFDAEWYLRTYADVARAGVDPHKHYMRFGRAEGRLPCFLAAASRERDLRFGLLTEGVAGFAPLIEGPDPAERVWARLACARAAAGQNNWAQAAGWLEDLDPAKDLISGFGVPDHALLAIEVAVMTGQLAQATALLAQARKVYGLLPDLILAQANVIATKTGHGTAWHRCLMRLFVPRGLRGIALHREGTTPFDQLVGHGLHNPVPQGQRGPLVSVIMPAHNAGATIKTALQSLRTQSWQALEILVIDNGSDDDTADLVRGMAAQDARIHLIEGSAEPGAYPARNIGFAAAQGEFVTVLDADDWAHPARIALQVRALRGKPSRQASVSHWVRTTPDLRFTRWWGDQGLVHRNVSSLMIRTGLRDTLGYWDRTRAGADTEYYNRILAVFGARSIHEVRPGIPLSLGRSSTGSLTQSSETHIGSQYYGARRSYILASRRWHDTLTANAPAPLPQFPDKRPFVVPDALALGDPPAPLQAVETIQTSGIFDDQWYMQTYPDLRAQDVEGAAHYLSTGAAEGRDPGPAFSTTGYGLLHETGQTNPVVHARAQGHVHGDTCLPDLPGALPAAAAGRHLLFVGHQARADLFGAERSLLDMLDRAIATGATPSVLLPHLMNNAYRTALEARCHHIHLRPFGWRYGAVRPHPATVAQITKLIADFKIDALHQNTCVLDAPLLAARAAGIRGVVHVRELPAENRPLCFDMGLAPFEVRNQLLTQADHLVANSNAVARWLDDADRVSVRPNGVDPSLFDLPFSPTNPVRVALIGSQTRAKGLTDLITLALLCAKRGLPVRFVLVGSDHADLRAAGPLPDNVTHAGYTPTPAAALQQADIVLSLSKSAESFGRTVLEAMAAGRPVITYARGNPPDLVGTDGTAGYVVRADDVGAVLEGLTKMVQDPTRLTVLSTGARARAKALSATDLHAVDARIYGPAPPS